MDIYLTDFETNSRLQFPVMPKEISINIEGVFQNFSVIGFGNAKFPIGREAKGFSWSGILPGKPRQEQPFIRAWVEPNDVVKLFNDWIKRRKKLKLMVTGTPINNNVYLEEFTPKYSGGCGDCFYNIKLVQAISLVITVSKGNNNSVKKEQTRPSPPAPKTYTVVPGDSLWAIAEKMMGDGNKYPQLYEANKSVIDPRNQQYAQPKYTIYAGQVLTVDN
ncbi:MAG: LysM peptidoglycan-binding domain-containing protein [Oscillospiraceae bacterium]|nr:LysM peptidoglycan-binding domain-containing protein [Oscillospiraceae bacterium]